MPHQGISTKLHRENSLMLHGRGNILGVLHFALEIFMKETLSRRSLRACDFFSSMPNKNEDQVASCDLPRLPLVHGILVIKSGEDIVGVGVAVEKDVFSLDLCYCSSRGPKCTTL